LLFVPHEALAAATPRPFFLRAPPTAEIYTLSLHDALPISATRTCSRTSRWSAPGAPRSPTRGRRTSSWSGTRELSPARCWAWGRSEEHTSELQSRRDLVCRLLLEKKKSPARFAVLTVQRSR